MSKMRIFPSIVTLLPGDRQDFIVEAQPPPAMWVNVLNSGDIKADFSLEVDAGGSETTGTGAHQLKSGIGSVEITIDDQCRPTGGAGLLEITGRIFDVTGILLTYLLRISPTAIEVRDEGNNQIFTESYSTVSGDVWRLELGAGFKHYRNGVFKHQRMNFTNSIVNNGMSYTVRIVETTTTAPTRIPAPRLIGAWELFPVITWTAPTHGAINTTGPGLKTRYSGGVVSGVYTLTAAIEAANDATGAQVATAQITIPPLHIVGPTEITLQPSAKARFKTNYDQAQTENLIAWAVFFGGGSFTQGEFTAPALQGFSIVRATADISAFGVSGVNDQVADIKVRVPLVISNASNFTAAKASEQIDFDHNAPLPPTFIGVGSLVESTGGITVPLPNVDDLQTNDLLILLVETANETVSTPAGWAAFPDSPQGTGAAGGATSTALNAFALRVSGPVTAPTITDPGDHVIAQILAFRGVIDTGNVYDVTAGDTGASSTSVSIPGDTTTVPNCLIFQAVAHATDTATAQVSGYTNADLTSLTELTDISTTQGNGGGFGVVTGVKSAAGAFGATTATLATASVQGRITIALKPQPMVWSASAGSINSSSGLWTAPSLTGQTAKITVSNGTTLTRLDVPVLEVFPIDPSAPIKWERRKTALVSTAEDRTRSSRVKDKGDLSFEAWEITILNIEVAEMDTIADFFDAHYPGKKFIFDDNLRGLRKVVYFDSNISVEAASDCSVNATFRIVEA